MGAAEIIRFVARPAEIPLARLAAVLRLAGWEVRNLDLDLVAGRATVELHRDDGRWVLLSADALGRASIERNQRTVSLGRHSSARGRIPLSPQVADTFLGRQRFEGPRAALRSLCAYVADNPAPGKRMLSASEVRAAFAPLMSAPVARAALHSPAPTEGGG